MQDLQAQLKRIIVPRILLFHTDICLPERTLENTVIEEEDPVKAGVRPPQTQEQRQYTIRRRGLLLIFQPVNGMQPIEIGGLSN